MVLTVSFVLSSVTIAWLPPSSVRRVSVFTTLAPASERQDHTTSPSAQAPLVLHRLRVHRSPLPRIVTTRTPLCMRRDGLREDIVRIKRKGEYFLRKIWIGRIALKQQEKFDFLVQGFSGVFEGSRDGTDAKPNTFCPTGKSVCCCAPLSPLVIPGQDAVANPESVTTEGCISAGAATRVQLGPVVMDSGPALCASRNDGGGARFNPAYSLTLLT
jgi:hypothetical protein